MLAQQNIAGLKEAYLVAKDDSTKQNALLNLVYYYNGKSTQIDPLNPNETDPPFPFQIDPLFPAEIDPLKNG